MSVSFCVFHQKKHDDFNWRFVDYTDDKGQTKSGWFCREAFKPSKPKEYIPQRIKDERTEYAKSMLQPYREGVASREFIEAYPERAKQTFSPEDMRKSRYVWQGDVVSKHWRKSK